MYLREMGTVPLLTREGEVAIAKRIERGQLLVLKTITRAPLIVKELLQVGEDLKTVRVPLRKSSSSTTKSSPKRKFEAKTQRHPEANRQGRQALSARHEAGGQAERCRRRRSAPICMRAMSLLVRASRCLCLSANSISIRLKRSASSTRFTSTVERVHFLEREIGKLERRVERPRRTSRPKPARI